VNTLSSEEKPFKEETIGTKIFIVSVISLIICLAIGFVFGVYYFGILGVFNLLGVHYDSFFSLFLFVIFYFLLSLVGEIVIKVLFSVLTMNHLSTNFAIFLINILVIWSIISFLNYSMDSIEINIGTQLIASTIIAIAELTIENYDKKKA
jgi:Regulatory protein YrvL